MPPAVSSSYLTSSRSSLAVYSFISASSSDCRSSSSSASKSAASSESISSMMSAARSVPMSSMSERCVSASRCSKASAAVSSSSCFTTAAASRAERSLMISASSEGCSRESLLSVTESCTCDGLASRIGETESQAIIERGTRAVDCRRETFTERFQAQPAQQAGHADVGGDDAKCVAGARDLEVVDAHDFAAVDVDDLLVEQIGDEIQRLVARAGRARRARRVSAMVPCVVDARRRYRSERNASPCAVLMTSPSMRGNTSSGLLHEKIADFADRKIVDGRLAADEFGNEALGKTHRCHPLRKPQTKKPSASLAAGTNREERRSVRTPSSSFGTTHRRRARWNPSAALDIALARRSLVYPLGVSRRFWAAACVSRGRLT